MLAERPRPVSEGLGHADPRLLASKSRQSRFKIVPVCKAGRGSSANNGPPTKSIQPNKTETNWASYFNRIFFFTFFPDLLVKIICETNNRVVKTCSTSLTLTFKNLLEASLKINIMIFYKNIEELLMNDELNVNE